MAASIFLVSHPAPNPTMSPLFLIIRSPLWSVRPSNGYFALQFTRPTFRGRPSSTIFGYLAHLASVSGRWERSAEGDNEPIINEIRVSLLNLQPWTSNSLVCPANSWAWQKICHKMTFQGGACFNEDWQPTTVEYASMRVYASMQTAQDTRWRVQQRCATQHTERQHNTKDTPHIAGQNIRNR